MDGWMDGCDFPPNPTIILIPILIPSTPRAPPPAQHESAKKAMEELNAQKFPDGDAEEKELYVRRLQTKKERQKARGCGLGGGGGGGGDLSICLQTKKERQKARLLRLFVMTDGGGGGGGWRWRWWWWWWWWRPACIPPSHHPPSRVRTQPANPAERVSD